MDNIGVYGHTFAVDPRDEGATTQDQATEDGTIDFSGDSLIMRSDGRPSQHVGHWQTGLGVERRLQDPGCASLCDDDTSCTARSRRGSCSGEDAGLVLPFRGVLQAFVHPLPLRATFDATGPDRLYNRLARELAQCIGQTLAVQFASPSVAGRYLVGP